MEEDTAEKSNPNEEAGHLRIAMLAYRENLMLVGKACT